MDRQAKLDALKQLGFPTDSITEAVPDEVLDDMLRFAKGDGQQTDDHAEDDNPDSDASDADSEDKPAKEDNEDEQDHTDHDDEMARQGMGAQGIAADNDNTQRVEENDGGDFAEGDEEIGDGDDSGSSYDAPYSIEPDGNRGADAQEEIMDEGRQTFDDFAEMTREEMAAGLEQMGHDKAELDAMPDDQLEALYNSEVAGSTSEPGSKPPDANMADDANGSREDMVAALISQGGHTQEELDPLSDDQIKALFDAVHGGVTNHNEEESSDPANDSRYDQNQVPPGGVKPEAPPARQVKKMSETIAKQKAELAQVNTAIKAAREETSQILRTNRLSAVKKFCEDLVRQGRLLRRSVPETVARLMRAPMMKAFTFSEGGKTVKKSELELQMKELENGPLVASFAERMNQPMTNGNSEVARIKNHYRRFAEAYKRTNTTLKSVVGAFKIARKNNKQLTADQFLESKE